MGFADLPSDRYDMPLSTHRSRSSRSVSDTERKPVNAVLRAVAGEADFLKAGIERQSLMLVLRAVKLPGFDQGYGKDKAESIAAAF